MTATSSDETADGRNRKTAYKTRLERRRLFGGDEMAPHGGRARPLPRGNPLGARASRASSPEIDLTSSDETADGGDQKTAHETRLERHGPFGGDEMAHVYAGGGAPPTLEMPQIMVRSRELTGDKLDVI